MPLNMMLKQYQLSSLACKYPLRQLTPLTNPVLAITRPRRSEPRKRSASVPSSPATARELIHTSAFPPKKSWAKTVTIRCELMALFLDRPQPSSSVYCEMGIFSELRNCATAATPACHDPSPPRANPSRLQRHSAYK